MSSLSRKRGRSGSPSPPLGRKRHSKRCGWDGSLSSIGSTSMREQPVGPYLDKLQFSDTLSKLVVNSNTNVNHAPGGSIVNNNYNETRLSIYDSSSDVALIIEKGLSRHHFPGALHDAQPSDAGCMEGTRVQLLADMKNLLNIRGGAHIVWIAGMAGTGKTSIALTLCRILAKEPTIILGGTFFCSRSAGVVERTEVERIIPTFAIILARTLPAYAEAIAKELTHDPDLAHKSISAQVEHLLTKPLGQLLAKPLKHLLAKPLELARLLGCQIVFVVDALDECSDEEKLVELINALANFTSPIPVKFLFTSRPEMHIRETSIADTCLSSTIHLHTIDPAQVTADIRLYIEKTFEKVTTTPVWYTDDDINELAVLSGGLFIFASTALAYILRRKEAPGRLERLRTLKMQTSSSTLVTGPLDRMYLLVLTQASDPEVFEPTELNEMRRVIAVILSIRAPLTLKNLAEFLGLTTLHLRGTLEGLHAVILVPEEDEKGELRALHASFGDFIFTRAPEHIRVDKEYGHNELARACLKRMSADDLCFNISRRKTSFKPNQSKIEDYEDYSKEDDDNNDDDDDKEGNEDKENDDSDSDTDTNTDTDSNSDSNNDLGDDKPVDPDEIPNWIAGSLIYACLHWAHHVNFASGRSSFDKTIDFVFRRKLLFWLEVLSMIGGVRHASNLLSIAASLVSAEDLLLFLRDAISFVTFSHNAIAVSAPHIYLSALPFTPKLSLVRQNFAELFIGLPSIETFGMDYRAGRCLMVIAGHDEAVISISYSANGRLLASASSGSTVRLWDARSGAEIRKLETGHDELISSITFTPDSHYLVAGTAKGNTLRWDVNTGRLIPALHRQPAGNVSVVVVSPDATTIASGFQNGMIDTRYTHDGQPTCSILSGHEGSVWAMAFSPDGKTLASSGMDCTVRIWDYRLGKQVGEPLIRDEILVSCFAFSPDGDLLAYGSWEHVVCIWDTKTGQQHRTYSDQQDSVNSVAFAPDGRAFALGSDDHNICIWNLQDDDHTLAAPLVLYGHHDSVNAVCFSTDGLRVASCSDDGTIRVWDVGSIYSATLPLDGPTDCVTAVAVSGNSRLIASALEDGSVCVWDACTCEPVYSPLLGDAGPVQEVAFSSDSRWVAAGSLDSVVRLRDAQTGHPTPSELRGHKARVNTVEFSPNSLHLASGSNDCTVRVWDVSITQPAQILQIQCNRAVKSVAYSPDGTLIAAGEVHGNARIFDATTGQQVRSPKMFRYGRGPLAFSPDGARIVVPVPSGKVVAFDIHTGAKDVLAPCHTKHITALAYSPDRQLTAFAARDKTIRLWDTKSAKALEPVLGGHSSPVRSVVFSPDGRFLVTGGRDSTIRVWDIKNFIVTHSDQNALVPLTFARSQSGWLVSQTKMLQLLLWVPPEYRGCLEIDCVSRVIASRRAVVTADDGVLHQGKDWARCWRADNSSSSRLSVDSTMVVQR